MCDDLGELRLGQATGRHFAHEEKTNGFLPDPDRYAAFGKPGEADGGAGFRLTLHGQFTPCLDTGLTGRIIQVQHLAKRIPVVLGTTEDQMPVGRCDFQR